jgi:ABC-type nickel/cobalt efflux system permease component RcnA
MSTLTKTMLGLTIVNAIASALFLTGIVNISGAPGLYVVFPLAAICYGMFLICRMLQKDVAEFDAEQRAHQNHAPEEHPHNVESLHDHDHHESIAA